MRRPGMRLAALLVTLALCIGADDCGDHDGSVDEPPPGPFAGDAARYLPLQVGMRWVLRKDDSTVRVEIARKEDDAYVLEFENPWSFHEYRIVPEEGRIYRVGLREGDYPGDVSRPALFWDFTAEDGARWSNALGRMKIDDRGKEVETPTDRFTDTVRIKEKSSQGHVLVWTFARDVGLVEFGAGFWKFRLDRQASVLDPARGAAEAAKAKPAPRRRLARRGDRVMLALAATLAPSQDYTVRNRIERFEQTLDAGVTYVYLSPKWDVIEPKKDRWDWNKVDFWVSQARRHGVAIIVNLRILDTGNVSRPKDLEGKDWDDPEIRQRLLAAIDRLVPRLEGTTTYFLVGNEIASYFEDRPKEVAAYTALWSAAARRIKELAPGAQVSASVTFTGLEVLDRELAPLDQIIDYLAVTYYPLNSDFTMRPPRDVKRDFETIARAAKGRRILIQEVGYSSSPINRSSPAMQAEFYSRVFDELERREDQIIGANFLWMSDLSDDLVEEFGKYYRLPNAKVFKAYLKYLGIFDDENRPKPAWTVFQERGPVLTN